VVPVTLKLLPFASVPMKFVCAVWADADALHHRMVLHKGGTGRVMGGKNLPIAPGNPKVQNPNPKLSDLIIWDLGICDVDGHRTDCAENSQED
jgi:hypothetical protein